MVYVEMNACTWVLIGSSVSVVRLGELTSILPENAFDYITNHQQWHDPDTINLLTSSLFKALSPFMMGIVWRSRRKYFPAMFWSLARPQRPRVTRSDGSELMATNTLSIGHNKFQN